MYLSFNYFDLVIKQYFGWSRLLVEVNPIHRSNLKKQVRCFVANAAICDSEADVHFIQRGFESGIVEFMSNATLARAFTNAHDEEILDFLKRSGTIVKCVPLSYILSVAKVSHINFFILDVEGAELSILHTINWNSIRFDVISVETEMSNRPKGYEEAVTAFLAKVDYTKVANIPGRNSWYTHVSFIPSKRPGTVDGCFAGALWSMIYRNKNESAQPYFQPCPPAMFLNKCQNCPLT